MTAETKTIYTTSLSKGQALISETLTLLHFWEPGMSADVLENRVRDEGVLAKTSAVRVHDIVKRIFAGRYLCDEGRPAQYLKFLLERDYPLPDLFQLLLIYTARFHTILHDFITEVYWPKYAAGATTISRDDAEAFLEDAVQLGRIPKRWSHSLTIRNARYLTGCLVDFQMAKNEGVKTKSFLPVTLSLANTVYLAHELHFKGYSDTGILEHPDWRLFGLYPEDVYTNLDQAARAGHFIAQYSGELLRISWNYQTMEECLDVLTQ